MGGGEGPSIYIFHIFFIHLSAGGHLGCFHVLTMRNSFLKLKIPQTQPWKWLRKFNIKIIIYCEFKKSFKNAFEFYHSQHLQGTYLKKCGTVHIPDKQMTYWIRSKVMFKAHIWNLRKLLPSYFLLSSSQKQKLLIKVLVRGFPGGTVVKNPPANAGDTGSIPGPGRSHMPRNN